MGTSPKLKRPCERCEEYYTPTGKFQKFCEKCKKKKWKEMLNKKNGM